jgi:hypothetical protein
MGGSIDLRCDLIRIKGCLGGVALPDENQADNQKKPFNE